MNAARMQRWEKCLRRDGAHMGFSESIDTILNWTGLKCSVSCGRIAVLNWMRGMQPGLSITCLHGPEHHVSSLAWASHLLNYKRRPKTTVFARAVFTRKILWGCSCGIWPAPPKAALSGHDPFTGSGMPHASCLKCWNKTYFFFHWQQLLLTKLQTTFNPPPPLPNKQRNKQQQQ